jgi:hypothetical protein
MQIKELAQAGTALLVVTPSCNCAAKTPQIDMQIEKTSFAKLWSASFDQPTSWLNTR